MFISQVWLALWAAEITLNPERVVHHTSCPSKRRGRDYTHTLHTPSRSLGRGEEEDEDRSPRHAAREERRRKPELLSRTRLCDPMDFSPPGSLSVGFSRQEYWSGLPFPPPGDLPDPGIEPMSLGSPALADRSLFFTTSTTCERHVDPNSLMGCIQPKVLGKFIFGLPS